MSKKNLLKYGIAIGLVAIILIFLGVNYVPRISAFSPAKESIVNKAVQIPSERYQQAIILRRYAGSDWIERHPAALVQPLNDALSDYYEPITSNRFSASDYYETITSYPFSSSDYLIPRP